MSATFRICRVIIEPVFRLFFPSKRLGYKEKPFDGPTVIVCNHISNWDSILVATCFKKESYFLCKKEVFKNKVLGSFVRRLGGIKIDREKPEFNEIKTTLKLLKDRKRLVIFPEGTRNKSKNGDLLPIKGGAGMFAYKAKARIIPMYINKPTRFLRRNFVFIGEPFTLDEFYGEKFTQELAEKINQKIKEQILFCKDKLNFYFVEKKQKKVLRKRRTKRKR